MMKNGKEGESIVMNKWARLNTNFIREGVKIYPVQENGNTP